MKKKIWIPILCAALLLMIVAAVFYFESTGVPSGEVTIHYGRKAVTLTPDEADLMRSIFRFKFYNNGIGGCSYDQSTCITIGDTVYAIATDGCYTAKNWQNGRCFEFNREEYDQIAALFEKYFGKTPPYLQ